MVSPISAAQRLNSLEQYYFTPSLLASWLSLEPAQAFQLTARLKADGLATEVEKGKYLLLGVEPERILSNPLFIASQLVTPGYVSYWSALHHYGFTTQVPQTVFCATTKKKRPVRFRGQTFRYVTIQPRRFFGYRRERIGGLPVLIADEAKALVDSLSLLRYAGGLSEVAQALRTSLPSVEAELLGEYAVRMGDQSLAARLGYLLDALGRPIDSLPAASGPVALDPGRPRSGPLDSRWRVIVNVSIDQLLGEGVR